MLAIVSQAVFGLALLQGFSPAARSRTVEAPAADSMRILRAARSAQRDFEAFRRNRLPVGPGMAGPCDIRIGRYCYWRGDGDDDDKRPPEAQAVRERRDALIVSLDTASRILSGDPWLIGQRVRYLVEAERTDDAVRVARTECRATMSWCLALAGYAAHHGGKFTEAESAYADALAAMDSTERCRWLDIADLLEDDLEHRFSPLDCAARAALARRVLRVGAPMYSVSATDLFTEHLARVTRARMAEQAATPDGEPWGDDERTLMVRYGWPRWYSQSRRQDFGSQLRPSITGHDTGLPYNFLPNVTVLEHTGRATSDDWHLDDPRAPTGYAPSYARTVHTLPSQIARFRRGDSTLVVAAWDARRDTTLLGRPLDAALVIAVDGEQRAIARRSDERVVGHIEAIGLIDSGLVSLELLATKDRRAARERVGILPRTTGRVAVSDLLLYSSSAESPYELGAVRDSALASDVAPMSRTLGVFWETYGLRPEGEPVTFTLTVEQVGVGWLQRAAERLHFTDPTTGLRVQWQEVPQRVNGVAGRGVRVDLSRLRPGRYRLQLAVEASGDPTVTSVREIDVR